MSSFNKKKQNTSESTSSNGKQVTKIKTTTITELTTYSSQNLSSGTSSSSFTQSFSTQSRTPDYLRTQSFPEYYLKAQNKQQPFQKSRSLVTKPNTQFVPTKTNPLFGTSNDILGKSSYPRAAPVNSSSTFNKSLQYTPPNQSTKKVAASQTKAQNSFKPTQRPIPNINKASDAVPFTFRLPPKCPPQQSPVQNSSKPTQRPVPNINKASDAVPFTFRLPQKCPPQQSPVQNSSKPTQRPIPFINRPSDAAPFKFSPPPTILPQQSPKDDLANRLKIKVTKSREFCDQNRKEPTYQTHGKKRGYCLIINNIMFDNNSAALRNGAKLDGENLKELFTKMGFKVDYNENLKYRTMENLLNTHAKNMELKTMDISVVVIMSHGKGTKEGNTHIMCTDDRVIATCDIIDKFDNKNCPNLCNKPKIFIFQCCRGRENQIVEYDAAPTRPQAKKVNDMLLAYSTIPGYVSHRSPTFGTWYVQALCLVFMKHAHDTDVETMLKMVGEKLDSYSRDTFQTSSYENRGFKTCFLHPR